MSAILTGVPASPGIAIAKAYRLQSVQYEVVRTVVEDPQRESIRFQKAVDQAKQDLESIRKMTEQRLGPLKAEIFEAHLMVLEDPELIDAIKEKILQQKINAEFALHETSHKFIELLEGMDDERLRERASDVRDVNQRIMSYLLGRDYSAPSAITEPSILIAADLTPSDTAQLDRTLVKGFITEIGSRSSHSAIMARSLEIPAIVGVGAAAATIDSGITVILDGLNGQIVVNPTMDELHEYERQREQYEQHKSELRTLMNQPTVSKDGHRVELAANIGSVEDVEKAIENGAEAIGLFRTEFLYMNRNSLPSEDEQFQVYTYVLDRMGQRPVVIRTLDIGGDKKLPYLPLPEEQNPFLGFRAIRMCLEHQDLFRTQLRALLRASAHGNLKIMFPMIAVLEEFMEAKRILLDERDKLIKEAVSIADRIEVGMMVEIPSSALSASIFAKEVDFFSIGTNDLIQYTMAADRMNEKVAYLYQPYHPSVLRLVQMVITAAEKEGKWVSMCGEMAGDETSIPILLGLGLHEFSMSATSILPARALIRQLSKLEWSGQTEMLLSLRGNDQVRGKVRTLLQTPGQIV
ncbi:MAG: phosphoenolpyruvate-protein phosphotransferase [Bacilli bacterium]|nr:phosphoenolpyruvate-protein phosphotransferase [Bacilli bacterium]